MDLIHQHFDLEEPVFGLMELVVPQEKCHLLCFVLVHGEMVLGLREKAYELRDLACSLGELVLSHKKYCP